jgi:predicted RNA binding protein YcfA (HicA-like mRNA interferase family)
MKCSELLRLLKTAGWIEVRQSGSHIKLIHPEKDGFIIFPTMVQKKWVEDWKRKFENKQGYEKAQINC